MNSVQMSSYRARYAYACVMLMTTAAGCQSGRYLPATIPPEYRPLPTKANQDLDLSRISAPGNGTALLAPGDLLEISIATGREGEHPEPILTRIADNGSVDVPIIGSVPVAGLEAYAASNRIAKSGVDRGIYVHPVVTVEMKSKAVNHITVLGAVQEPGVHEIPRGSSNLVSALAAAGGFDESADSKIEIIRQPRYGQNLAVHRLPQDSDEPSRDQQGVQLASYNNRSRGSQTPQWSPTQTFSVDLAKATPAQRADYRLSDRDIVRVLPKKSEVIHVSGLVKEPGQFELPLDQEIYLLDAIALAGGRSSVVADKVFVIRHAKDQSEPILIQVSLSEAKQNGVENIQIVPGDMISIEQTPATVVTDAMTRFFRLSFGVANNGIF